MENMQYAEQLVREFLVFRGFTNSLQAFEKEMSTDIAKGYQPDKIMDLIFSVYIPKFQAENLFDLLTFFKQCFSSSETALHAALSKLDTSICRYYIIHAVQSKRIDKVMEFFETHGSELIHKDEEWTSWFAIPYIKSPHLDPRFRIYFSKEWYNALHLSLWNLLSQMFSGNRIPALLKISSERNTVNRLKKDVKQLNLRLTEVQALLEEKESQLCLCKRNESQLAEAGVKGTSRSSNLVDITEQSVHSPRASHEIDVPGTSNLRKIDHLQDRDNVVDLQKEEDFPEVEVEYQETFLGHTSSISRSRFSASGDNIASASLDGTVRIWTYESSVPATRNATIYCGAEVLSLDWECKSDRLLLMGTADGGIKLWNVDTKRVICDLNSDRAFPSVLDIKCSPVEPIFVTASASRWKEGHAIDQLGFASLSVWSMRAWKVMTVLPLGEDPPAITSLSFNHNGKLLAAAATDGMIHMFDMSAGLQITGWPAHDSAISSVFFGPDETSIFSLGTDGKVFEWSLQNQGKVLWSRDSNRFSSPQYSMHWRHEMALDANGRMLLLTSNSVRAPIYQVQGRNSGMRTLPHSSSITTVDWHPTLPIFLTGSADNSVRVTSMR